MKKFSEWLTARPARAALVAAAVAMLSLAALPVAAWLPASVVVLALLASGTTMAVLAAVGASMPIAWGFSPVLGLAGGLALAAAIMVPVFFAARLLAMSRNLSFAFQAVTVGAVLLLLAVHLLFGEPTQALAPLIDNLRPALEETARALADLGVNKTPEEIGQATARVAWATVAWMLLLQTMLALFLGLWAFGTMREPGLFGRQFRALKLGTAVAWVAVGALLLSLATQWFAGRAWQPAEDILFVLACAFLIQALAVVHGLRAAQVVGPAVVVLAYVGVALLPMAIVGLGFADSWVRFRERFPQKRGEA